MHMFNPFNNLVEITFGIASPPTVPVGATGDPPQNFLLSLIVETFWRKLNVNNITVKPYHTYNILHVITENRQKTGCFKIYVLNFLENKIFTPIDVYIFSLSNFPESFTDCEEPNSNYIVIVSAKIICTKIPIS